MTRCLTILMLMPLLLLGACQATGTETRWFRSVDKLGDGLRRHLSPERQLTAAANRLRHIGSWHESSRLAVDPGALSRSSTRMVSRLGHQIATGPQRMERFATRSLGAATSRFRRMLDPEPGLDRVVDLHRPGSRLDHVAKTWDDALGLNHTPLPSPTDPRHRTNPRDDRPVEGWGERVLGRLGL